MPSLLEAPEAPAVELETYYLFAAFRIRASCPQEARNLLEVAFREELPDYCREVMSLDQVDAILREDQDD